MQKTASPTQHPPSVIGESTVSFVREADAEVVLHHSRTMEKTGRADLLTKPSVLSYMEWGGKALSLHFLETVDEIGRVELLTREGVLSFEREIGPEKSCKYLDAVESTGKVEFLTSESVTSNARLASFLKREEPNATYRYLRALAATGSQGPMMSDEMLLFSRALGPDISPFYFTIVERLGSECGRYTNGSVLSSPGFFKFADIGGKGQRMTIDTTVEILNLGLGAKAEADQRVIDLVESYLNSERKLPAPNIGNIRRYEEDANRHLASEYGFRKRLDISNINMFFSSVKAQDDELNRIVDLVNASGERKGVVMYSLSSAAGSPAKYSKEELMRSAVVAVTERMSPGAPSSERSAMIDAVGDKRVNRANNEFHIGGSAMKVAVHRAHDYHEKYELLREYALSEKKETLLGILDYAAGGDLSRDSGVLVGFETNNPLDFDNSKQVACVFLPSGVKRGKGIMRYVSNSEMHLMDFTIGGVPVGCAIAFSSGGSLVVDSLEGGRKVRESAELMERMYSYILDAARKEGADKVVFNEKVGNDTPRAFLRMLREKGEAKRSKIGVPPVDGVYLDSAIGESALEVSLRK